ncbi:MAG: enoyl-CoA hydratase/isomerase family protein [Proteobacteria bacterium]|nr:enoyl-CoA hydratase/isomerase family protein [Pseudomonadota bacterium]
MAFENYNTLRVRLDRGVAFVTVDRPPMNLMDLEMMAELHRLALEIEQNPDVRVSVFDSADPDYFIAHFDVGILLHYPDKPPPRPSDLHLLNKACETFRRMPKVSMARIEGRTRGGGSEFVLGLDMRFGAIGKAVLGQPEVALGILPGGGGTQRLARLVGSARALEIVLGSADYPAELAERYGYLNRALPPGELRPFVEKLAYRMASFPAEALGLAKRAVLAASEMSMVDGLLEETHLFNQLAVGPAAKELMQRFLEVGGQTREGEKDIDGLYDALFQTTRNEDG